ncbi:MAG TPA: AMP-binding protein, partial [Gemmatimonadaceae bacterium]
ITRQALATFIDWLTGEQRFVPAGEVFLNQASFSFDLSVMDVYGALTTGGTLVSATRDHVDTPRELHAMLRNSGITTWVSTPTFAGMCLAEPTFSGKIVRGIRRFLFCGEVLPVETARALLDRFPEAEVWNTYGPTEATVATTSIRIDRTIADGCDALPVGVAMPAARVMCVDESLAAVPAGERGEIVIIGPNVSVGYVNRPDLTARSFFERDGMRGYRTGDWGRFVGNLLYCEGRIDSQIKLHGYRIELGEIESELRRQSGVRDAVVIPSMRQGRPWSLVAAVLVNVLPSDSRAAAETLRQVLAQRLPPYMIPRHVRFLTSLPMTPNGKADRAAIAVAVAPPR